MISIPIVSQFDSKGIKSAIKEFKQLETTSQKAQFAIKKAAVPAAAALTAVVAVIGKSVQGAIEDEAAQASLSRQIKASTGATDKQVASVEAYISSLGQSVAISDDKARPAFQKLVVATKDLTQAQDLLNIALDVSAATGSDLTGVSDALAKAFAGNMKPLAALSPELKSLIKEGASLDEVLGVLKTNFGGAAKAAGDTAAGGLTKLGIAFGETQEAIGTAFLPIMEKVLPVVQKFAAWAEANPDLLAAVVVGLGSLAVATLAVNAAMALNPAVLITAGIVALGVALVVAYKKFETFGSVVRTVVNGVSDYFEFMANGFIKVINLIIKGINLVKPGKDIPSLGEISIGHMNAPSVDTPSTSLDNIGRAGSAERAESNVTINVNGGDPNAVVNALRAYMRQNGNVPIRTSAIG
jgi:hypothetical protein